MLVSFISEASSDLNSESHSGLSHAQTKHWRGFAANSGTRIYCFKNSKIAVQQFYPKVSKIKHLVVDILLN